MNRSGLSLAVLAVLAALAACTPAHEAQTEASTRRAGSPMSADSMTMRRLPQETAFRFNSGLESPAREVVRDAGSWGRTWSRLSGSGSASTAPEVDFAREMALVAAMGRRSTGGYEIRIDSVERTGSGLEVRVVETSPGPTCGTGQALSSPADVVLVPRSTLPVRWTVRQVVTDCG